ncbi:hypothetical protein F0562_001793 [Nyssa sinensis]|uniref:SHSP domain-containing protein n=1 Tax=Nyssa sinensis TaxID=561372 RepID=A0A5J5C4N7_9ASTE|nr:hypothetical protein F0562_001793 [Nyssa sinensis]
MDKKHQAEPRRVYEHFEPASDRIEEEACNTILLYLAGFKKDELKVQVTTTRMLKISGEHKVKDTKWRRFYKEFPVSENCDINKITAKFEDGILYLTQPKLITLATEKDKSKPISETPRPLNPEDEPQSQRGVQEKDSNQKTASMTEKTNRLANAKEVPEKALEKKELSNVDGQRSESMDAKNVSQKTQEEEKSDVATKDGNFSRKTSEKHENLGDSVNDAAQMDSGTTSNVHAGGKMGTENYKQPVGELAEKLKKPRKLINLVLVILAALVLGMYVTNFIRSSKKDE